MGDRNPRGEPSTCSTEGARRVALDHEKVGSRVQVQEQGSPHRFDMRMRVLQSAAMKPDDWKVRKVELAKIEIVLARQYEPGHCASIDEGIGDWC